MPTHLARLLVEAGIVSQEVADSALRRHVAVGGALDTVLLEADACSETRLLEALGAVSELPAAFPGEYAQVDPKTLSLFPFKLADRYGMCPISMGKRHFDVALTYPVEKLLLEELSFMLGKDLRPRVSLEVRVREAIALHYKKPLAARFSNLLRKLGKPPAAPTTHVPAPVTVASLPAAPSGPPPRPATIPPRSQPAPQPPPDDEPLGPPPEPEPVRTLPALPAAPALPTAPTLPVADEPLAPEPAPAPIPVEVELVVEPAQAPLEASSPFAATSGQVEQSLPQARVSWVEEGPSPFDADLPEGEEDVRVEDEAQATAPTEANGAGWTAPPEASTRPISRPPPSDFVAPEPPPYPVPPPIEPAHFHSDLHGFGHGEEEQDVQVEDDHPAHAVEAAPVVAPPAPVEPAPPAPAPVGPPPLPSKRNQAKPASAVEVAPVEPAPPAPAGPPPLPTRPRTLPPPPSDFVAPEPPPYPLPSAPPPAPPPVPVVAEPPPPPVVEPAPAPVAEPAPAPVPAKAETSDEFDVDVDLGEPGPPVAEPAGPVVSVPTLTPRLPPPERPQSETARRFLTWDVTASGLGGIEEALTSVDLEELARAVAEEEGEEPLLVDSLPSRPPPSVPVANGAPAPLTAPARPATAPRTSWSLTEARHRLSEAPGRDEIIEVALRFALKSFEYAAALAVRSGTAFGWRALDANGGEDERMHNLALPLDAQSVLRTVLRARGRYLGPLPDDELTRKILAELSREPPAVALIYPVFVRERPVAFFYADRGRRLVSAARVAEFLLFAQELSTAFERAILRNKRGRAPAPAPAPTEPGRATTPSTAVRAVAVAPMLTGAKPPSAQPAAPLKVTLPSSVLEAPRADADELLFHIEEEPPEVPAGPKRNVFAIIDDLLKPDRKRRLAAMAELQAMPEIAAPALAQRFPGPTSMRRGLVGDLPEPEEIGPIAAGLARLKDAAVPFVARILAEGDPDARFFAVLLAGAMKSAQLLPGLLGCLFDPVPEVATAARAAAEPLHGVAGFEEQVLKPLRAELGARDPDRVCAAARALSRLRDVPAIPLLIPLTGHADDRVVAEASEALTQITKQTHGDSPRKWQIWFDGNKNRSRQSWLVEGLAHKDLQVRLSSIEELVEEANDSFGFIADGNKRDREKAIDRWYEWLKAKGK